MQYHNHTHTTTTISTITTTAVLQSYITLHNRTVILGHYTDLPKACREHDFGLIRGYGPKNLATSNKTHFNNNNVSWAQDFKKPDEFSSWHDLEQIIRNKYER